MTKSIATEGSTGVDRSPSIREKNVEAFLDAAERLLIRVGAAGISTRQLAKEAGQNHGLVHYYFGSVDELLLQALERFTTRILERQRAMYGSDAPFIEKWRAAMGFIEEDLASGYPKVWAEMQALGWNRPELRDRLQGLYDRWRTLLRDALSQAMQEYGLDGPRTHENGQGGLPFSAETMAALVMQFNEGLIFERLLGFDRGHEALLAAIDAWLGSLENGARKDKRHTTPNTKPTGGMHDERSGNRRSEARKVHGSVRGRPGGGDHHAAGSDR